MWHAGYDATLKVETNAGKACVTLQAGLGSSPFPFPPPQHIPHHVPRRSGPAQRRRRERREADRRAASENNLNANPGATQAEEAEAPAASEQVAEEVADNSINDDEATVEEVEQNVIEKAAINPRGDFECEPCDRSFKNIRALRAHEGRSHKENTGSPITQLDGQSEKVEDNLDTSDDEDIGRCDDEEHSCDVCEFVAKTLTDVQTHKKTKHLFARVKGWTS